MKNAKKLSKDSIDYIKARIISDGCIENKDGTFQATNFGAVCTAEFWGCTVNENWIVKLPA